MTETRERLTPEERGRRQRRLMTVGEYLYGPSWQHAMATRLEKRGPVAVPRVRLNQWATGAKPLPGWMLPVLATVAREAAAELRQRALKLDVIAEGGDPPPDTDEPEAIGEPPLESGPTAAQADTDADFDAAFDEFVEAVASEPPRHLDDAMPTAADVETRLVHSAGYGWSRQPVHPLGR